MSALQQGSDKVGVVFYYNGVAAAAPDILACSLDLAPVSETVEIVLGFHGVGDAAHGDDGLCSFHNTYRPFILGLKHDMRSERAL